ncbi:MAG: cation transporter [Planctomycetes bacterium]|nr:cation transporter [Planctomycetota bacterium]
MTPPEHASAEHRADQSHRFLHPDLDFGSGFHTPAPKAGHVRRIVRVLILNGATMVVEVIGGLWTGSLALLSDAGHMLTHILALGMTLLAILLARRGSSARQTYGSERAEVVAAFFNAATIFFVVLWIVGEAVAKIVSPREIRLREMLVVAGLGLVVNLWSAFLLADFRRGDLNVRSAFFHLLSDTLSSLAIIAGGVTMHFTGWQWIDPALALVIAGVIAAWAAGLLRDSTRVLLEQVPPDLDLTEVCAAVEGIPGVREVHDVHLWEIAPGRRLMTGHVIVEDLSVRECEAILDQVNRTLAERFGIGHTTFQFETRRGT